MVCKHKNKIRLYKRLKTTWQSTQYFECQDCGAVLEQTTKLKMVIK